MDMKKQGVTETVPLIRTPLNTLSPDVNTWLQTVRENNLSYMRTERQIKLSTKEEEILKKAELVINARNSFVYNDGAKG